MSAAELELKLDFSEAGFDRFRRQPIMRALTVDGPRRRKLRSTYFDTPDLRLARADASIRVRKDGDRWIQTLKLGTRTKHGVSNPIEIEDEVAGPALDLDKIGDARARKKLRKIVGGERLAPVVETDVWRTTRLLEIEGAGSVELALDNGVVRAGDRTEPLREVEIELADGPRFTLLTAAEALASSEVVTVSERSKAQRGFALLEPPEPGGPLTPAAHAAPPLTRKMRVADAMAATCRAAADQILGNWPVVLASSDPEGPHQLRVGLRRLRTALRVFRREISDDGLRRLADDARDLARVVGRLRDADVMILDIVRPAMQAASPGARKNAPSEAGRRALDAALEAHLERERAQTRAALLDPRWSRLKLDCILIEAAIERATRAGRAARADAPLSKRARRALDQCWRRAAAWGRRIDKLDVPERHEMRKALKTLRYAVEYFQPLYKPSATRAFLKGLKRLQDVFGYLNDVALSDRLPSIVAASGADDPQLAAAVEAVRAWHARRAKDAWRDAKRRWRRLVGEPRFWR